MKIHLTARGVNLGVTGDMSPQNLELGDANE